MSINHVNLLFFTQSFYLEEFEDLMDELLFHLHSMSDKVNTLSAKEVVYETQSNFSFPISQHDPDSDSEVIINSQLH